MIRANSVPPEPSGTSAIGVMLPGRPQARIGQERRRGVLGLDLDASECRVGHLQHPTGSPVAPRNTGSWRPAGCRARWR